MKLSGYGNIVPTTDLSKIFCIFYTLMGIPLMFLALTNIGQFLAEGYWIFLASLSRKQVWFYRTFLFKICCTDKLPTINPLHWSF